MALENPFMRKLDTSGNPGGLGAPAAGTQAGSKARALGTRAGQGLRKFVDDSAGRLETTIAATTAAPRAAAGVARDFGRAVAGLPESPQAGRPVPSLRVQRPFSTSPASPANRPDFSNVVGGSGTTEGSLAASAVTPAIAPAAPATLRNLNGRPGSFASGVGQFGENAYDNASVERFAGSVGPAASTVATPVASAAPAAVTVPQVQAPTLVLPRSLSGDLDGAEKERQQRLSDIDSAMFGLRGRLNSRGRRDMYATLLGQQNQLTRDRIGQVTGLETEAARLANAGAIEQARLGAQAEEGNANRALQTDELNTNAALKREGFATARLVPQFTLRGVDGSTSLVRNDGTLTPLTGADGQAFREAIDPAASGSITQRDLFQAYREELSSINENALLTPDERQAMRAELEARPEYASVLGSIRKPTLRRS